MQIKNSITKSISLSKSLPTLWFLLFIFIERCSTEEIEGDYFYGVTDFNKTYIENSFQIETFYGNTTNITCPIYSSGPRVVYKTTKINETQVTICDATFACHKNECVYYKSQYDTFWIKNRKQFAISFVKEDEKQKKLTLHSCSSRDEYCNNQNKCTKPSDCYSNNCLDGRCVINVELPMYICRVKYLEGQGFSMGCGLDVNEKCTSSESCSTNYCSPYVRMCFDSTLNHKISNSNQYLVPFFGFVIFLTISSILYLYYIRSKMINPHLSRYSTTSSMSDSNQYGNQRNHNNRNNRNNHDDDEDSDVVFNNIYYHN